MGRVFEEEQQNKAKQNYLLQKKQINLRCPKSNTGFPHYPKVVFLRNLS